MNARRTQSVGGFTLIEVMMAGVISALVAGGTMAAFVTAARITRVQNNPSTTEAVGYARDTVDHLRNMVACDPGQWYAGAGCTPALPAGWVAEPIGFGAGGSESILNGPTRRCYRAQPADCDGVGGAGDCVAVEVRVCWNDLANCTGLAPGCP